MERVNRLSEENRRKIAEADERLSELNDRRVELSVGNERKDGELRLARERMSTYRSRFLRRRTFWRRARRGSGKSTTKRR